MGRRINQAEALQEAETCLRHALALLDQALAFDAAIHAATALDVLARSDQIGYNKSAPAGVSGYGVDLEFSIKWGTLADRNQIDKPLLGDSNG
jgi:hypothetical protein